VTVFLSGLLIFPLAGQAKCLTISRNLTLGDSDSKTSGAVSLLQSFLISKGLLLSQTTGRFGALTKVAVRKFQSGQGINGTGTAGPLTLSAIIKESCASAVSKTPLVLSIPSLVTASSSIPAVSSPTPTVLLSGSGSDFLTGQNYSIIWTNKDGTLYNILLEDENGVGEGYIASNQMGANPYSWKAGFVSAGETTSQIVAPGKYRIRVSNASSYDPKADQHSAFFTITSIPLLINSIDPSSVSADGEMAVIHGQGFNARSMIELTGGYYQDELTPSFISSSGQLINFVIPPYIQAGQYRVLVANIYSDSASTTSNALDLNIVPKVK